MKQLRTSIDQSNHYQQTAAVDIARPDTTAGCGNLAYVMKNATIVVNTIRPLPLLYVPKPNSLNKDSNQTQEHETTHPPSQKRTNLEPDAGSVRLN